MFIVSVVNGQQQQYLISVFIFQPSTLFGKINVKPRISGDISFPYQSDTIYLMASDDDEDHDNDDGKGDDDGDCNA